MMKGIFGYASSQNYPGGDALMLFHKTYAPNYTTRMSSYSPPPLSNSLILIFTALSTPPHAHICNLAAQTGASLFMQFNALPYHPSFVKPAFKSSSPFQIPPEPWIYNKTENLSIRDLTLSTSITHLISEVNPESEEGVVMEKDWKLVVPVTTRSRSVPSWKILKGEWPWEEETRLWIYERRWSQIEA
jgi:alpha-1,6-mannosyltransferase